MQTSTLYRLMITRNSLFLLFLVVFSTGFSQNEPRTVSIKSKSTDVAIEIDGKLREDIWSQLEPADGFYQNFPSDDQPAIDDTQFMVTYDQRFIYVGIKCFDGLQGNHIATTLRRDFNWIANDNVSVYLDPYNDLSNGFSFQVTPNNVQREGLVLLDGDVQDDWDNKWYSEVFQGDGF